MGRAGLGHHRKSIRLKGYDYSQAGAYFVTICVKNKECLFGEIVNGEMILNAAGKIAFDEWNRTPEVRPNIELDAFVIMPNHMHGIIVINDIAIGRGVLHTPNDTNANASDNYTDTQGVCNTPLRSPSQTVGAIVRGYKSSVTKQINILNNGVGVTHYAPTIIWQRNYPEHIIRNEQSYKTIADYIVNNPAKWRDDKFFV